MTPLFTRERLNSESNIIVKKILDIVRSRITTKEIVSVNLLLMLLLSLNRDDINGILFILILIKPFFSLKIQCYTDKDFFLAISK